MNAQIKNSGVVGIDSQASVSSTFSTTHEGRKRTTEELIKLVVHTVNTWTEHGKLTLQTKYPKNQPYWKSLAESLGRLGFTILGSGYFSFALAHPEMAQRVLKVGLKKEDSAAAYIAWCRMNAGRVGVPVIYTTVRSSGCYVVEMDHLLPIDTNNETWCTAWRAAQAGIYGYDLTDDTWGHFKRAASQHKDLYETAKSVREFFMGLARFDLHDENVMVDIQGNVIITDPVSYSEDHQGKRQTDWELLDNPEELTRMHTSEKARRAEREAAREARNEQRMIKREEHLRKFFVLDDVDVRNVAGAWVDAAQLAALKLHSVDSRGEDALQRAHRQRLNEFMRQEALRAALAHREDKPLWNHGIVRGVNLFEWRTPEVLPVAPKFQGVADGDGNIVTDLDKQLDAMFRG